MKMRKQMKKWIASLCLVAMMLSFLPAAAFAEEDPGSSLTEVPAPAADTVVEETPNIDVTIVQVDIPIESPVETNAAPLVEEAAPVENSEPSGTEAGEESGEQSAESTGTPAEFAVETVAEDQSLDEASAETVDLPAEGQPEEIMGDSAPQEEGTEEASEIMSFGASSEEQQIEESEETAELTGEEEAIPVSEAETEENTEETEENSELKTDEEDDLESGEEAEKGTEEAGSNFLLSSENGYAIISATDLC